MSMADIQAQHARLIILRALVREPGNTMNSAAIQDEVETFGIIRTREWVTAQLSYLAEAQAVALTEAGTVKIVRLRQRGADHVDRRISIDGVKRPSAEA